MKSIKILKNAILYNLMAGQFHTHNIKCYLILKKIAFYIVHASITGKKLNRI